MTEPTINCPQCSTEIKLTESLAAPLVQAARKEYEAKISAKEAEVSKREEKLRTQQKDIAKAQQSIDEQVTKKLDIERTTIVAEEAKKAKLAAASDLDARLKELAGLQKILRQKDEKLAEAQKAQADFLKKQRELDDAKRELDVTVEKRIQESVSEVREKAKKAAESILTLKIKEKEEQITSMQRKIEELSRKAEQGSQQLQGEAMELSLEETLRSKFLHDSIEPVPKGEFGGDVIHRVSSPAGLSCGTILWESKRTKHWSDGWLSKLRSDQRAAKAEISILVTQTLPKDIDSFEQSDGVWVCAPQFAIPLVMALRHTLVEVANSKQFQVGQETKSEMIYQYFTGPRFRQRVSAIVESFTYMQEDIKKERKVIMKQWAKREKQIEMVMGATVGMYGDLQGIAGQEVPEIDALELKALSIENEV
jgi:hypothetical protein